MKQIMAASEWRVREDMTLEQVFACLYTRFEGGALVHKSIVNYGCSTSDFRPVLLVAVCLESRLDDQIQQIILSGWWLKHARVTNLPCLGYCPTCQTLRPPVCGGGSLFPSVTSENAVTELVSPHSHSSTGKCTTHLEGLEVPPEDPSTLGA